MLRPHELLIAETRRTPEEILGHPNFPAARAAFVDAVLGLYEHDAFLNRLVVEAGRNVMFIVMICLHARYAPETPSTWPTISHLKKAMAQSGLASPRRIDDLVRRLCDTGFIRVATSPIDGRVRLLTPSDMMLKLDADWLVANYVPLQLLYAEPGYPQIMARDRNFQMAHRSIAYDFVGHGAQMLAGNPDMLLFMTRAVGVMALMKLIQIAGSTHEQMSEGLSYAEIGERFGATRTHIRSILQEAEKAGLVSLIGRGGRLVKLTPRILAAFDRFLAEGMSGHDMLFNLASSVSAGKRAAGRA